MVGPLVENAESEASILLDNSTYFSFKRVIESGHIDADSLYNTANFLECLLIADKVVTSPTLAWTPGQSDVLYSSDGPCRQLSAKDLTDPQLQQAFSKAVAASLKDLDSHRLRKSLATDKEVAGATMQILEAWKPQINESPRAFLEVYSGAVFQTDPASSDVLSDLRTTVSLTDEPPRHLAQYLLRTNAALEFTHVFGSYPIPYHPHSFRVAYVIAKLQATRNRSMSLASALIREAEEKRHEEVLVLQRSWLAAWGAFTNLGEDVPLVLSVALSGSTLPEDIVKRVLELRESKEARRYRKWAAQLIDSIRSGNEQNQIRANQELRMARDLLAKELKKLYGAGSGSLLRATSSIASAVDLEDLAEVNVRKMGISALKEAVTGAPKLKEIYETAKMRQKIALLIKLVRGRTPEVKLNDLVERVFGARLSEEDMRRFAELRQVQRDAMSGLKANK